MIYKIEQFKLVPRNMPGVYKITNLDTGKYYVGLSKDIYKRWSRHIQELKLNKHVNNKLQNAWNKSNNFVFEVLEECTKDTLQKKEHYWIDKLDCYNPDKGYNLYDNRKAKIWLNIQRKKAIEQSKYEDIVLVNKTNIADRRILTWESYKTFSGRHIFPTKNSFKDWFVFKVTDNIDNMLPDLIRKTIAGGYYRNPAVSNGSKQTWAWNKNTKELIGTYSSMGEAARLTNTPIKKIHTWINKRAIKDILFTSTDYIPESYTTVRGAKSKPVTIDGVEYASIKEASQILNINEQWLRDRLRTRKSTKQQPQPKYILYKDDTEIPLIHKVDAINHIPNSTKNGIKKMITGERPKYFGWQIKKL